MQPRSGLSSPTLVGVPRAVVTRAHTKPPPSFPDGDLVAHEIWEGRAFDVIRGRGQWPLHRRGNAATDVHACRFQRSIRQLLRRADEYPGSSLQLVHVTRQVRNDRGAGRDDDLLLAVLVIECQHLTVCG